MTYRETVVLTQQECYLLSLEFSNHFLNRDRYQETKPILDRILRLGAAYVEDTKTDSSKD